MKKIIILVLLFVLCACEIQTSSSSSTTTTITTNGTTTTKTTTIENGVSITDLITSSEDDPTGLRNKWHELFSQGAEGVSNDGYNVYFIYDNPEDITLAAIMILNDDNSKLFSYLFGEVVPDDEKEGWYKIEDVDGEESLPFYITDKEVEDGFEMEFKDGDKVLLGFTDQDIIIDDMISLWEIYQEEFTKE